MESTSTLIASKDSFKALEELHLIDSSKCLENLLCTKQMSLIAKSDAASTCADDTISTKSSLSLSPKRPSAKRKSSKRGLGHNFTLKEIATKRKYIKRADTRQVFVDLPTKKVKKTATETRVKLDALSDANMMMLVWEDGKAKLVSLQEPQQSLTNSLRAQKFTTSQSFKRHNHTLQWTSAETAKFFRALEIFGTDFSMISMVFPQRNRLQIKNKFIKEEKLDFENVNQKLAKSASNEKSRLKIFRRANLLQDNLGLNEQINQAEKSERQLRQRANSFSSVCSTNDLDQHEFI